MSSLDMLKRHLNLIATNDDDELLSLFVESAIEHTRLVIGAETLDFETAPAPIRLAIVMLAAHHYENREATIAGMGINPVPFGYLDLCAAYRAWEFN